MQFLEVGKFHLFPPNLYSDVFKGEGQDAVMCVLDMDIHLHPPPPFMQTFVLLSDKILINRKLKKKTWCNCSNLVFLTRLLWATQHRPVPGSPCRWRCE